jgi:undecaprenyl diphosphate synthase
MARYVAIIADGNGRWASERGLTVRAGHDAAADTLSARVRDAVELGVEELTVYAFSTENWTRPEQEVHDLMELVAARMAIETPGLQHEGVRVRFLGRRESLPPALIGQIDAAQSATETNTRMTLFIAFNYGGRAEILDAARRYNGGGEAEFRACLYAPDMHDPDIIIRTGAEQRLSNYLLWQSAYSELVFREELWPDFDRRAFEQSLAESKARDRRFGGR